MRIEFEFTTQYGIYKDALTLRDDHGLSDEEIQLLKEARLDNWVSVITRPEVIDEPILEPLIEEVTQAPLIEEQAPPVLASDAAEVVDAVNSALAVVAETTPPESPEAAAEVQNAIINAVNIALGATNG